MFREPSAHLRSPPRKLFTDHLREETCLGDCDLADLDDLEDAGDDGSRVLGASYRYWRRRSADLQLRARLRELAHERVRFCCREVRW